MEVPLDFLVALEVEQGVRFLEFLLLLHVLGDHQVEEFGFGDGF